jgi:hypothetical protein
MDRSEDEDDEEEQDDEGDQDEDENIPRKRPKNTPPPGTKRRATTKTNGVSRKAQKQKKPRKTGTAEIAVNTTECPMLGISHIA